MSFGRMVQTVFVPETTPVWPEAPWPTMKCRENTVAPSSNARRAPSPASLNVRFVANVPAPETRSRPRGAWSVMPSHVSSATDAPPSNS